MNFKSFIVCAILALGQFIISANKAQSQDISINITAVDYFNTPMDARATGSGQNQAAFIALTGGVQANPGILGFLQGFNLVSNYREQSFFGDKLQRRFQAVGFHIQRIGTFALGYNRLHGRVGQDVFDPEESELYRYTYKYSDDLYSLSFGTAFLNMIGIGSGLTYVDRRESITETNSGDLTHFETSDWTLDLGVQVKTPLVRFYSDLLDDELRFGGSFSRIGWDPHDTQNRWCAAYEISPIIFLPSLDSHFHPFNFVFAYEIASPLKDADNNRYSKALGLEIGLGEIFYYRLGNYSDNYSRDDDTKGFGIRLPIDILSNDEWPVQVQYDRATGPFTDDTVHSFKLNIRFEGKLDVF